MNRQRNLPHACPLSDRHRPTMPPLPLPTTGFVESLPRLASTLWRERASSFRLGGPLAGLLLGVGMASPACGDPLEEPAVGLITAAEVTTAGTTSHFFNVVFLAPDGRSIDADSIGTADVSVTGPGEIGALTVTYAAWDAGSNTATYTVKAPGGVWNSSDNGSYTIGITGSEVADSEGAFVPASASAATFTVSAPAYSSPSGTTTGAQVASVYYSVNASLTAYTNQLHSTPVATMTRGGSSHGGMSVNNISGASANVAGALWADLNADGDFDDPGERITTMASSTITNGSNWPTNTSGAARIPINFPGSQLRLRVIGVLGNTVPSGPEITGYTGEYVDALVTIAPNTAPTLDTGLTYALADMVSDDADPVGFDVLAFLDAPGDSVTDPDANASSYEGLAVVAGTGDGVWQFSTDYGATWTTATGLGDHHAILLRKNSENRLRFVPAGPGPISLTFRAWDRTEGNSGDLYNITAEGGTGGTNGFSTQSVTVGATVFDAATGGGSTLYIGGNDLGRFFAAALDAVAGTALPARTLFTAEAALYGYQFAYRPEDGFLYWAQNYGNLYRALPDGSDLTALTSYDTNNGGAIVGFGLSGSDLRYLFANYSTGDFQLYGATAGGSITPTDLSNLGSTTGYGFIDWDGTSLFLTATSSPQSILAADASGASAASLATTEEGRYLYAMAHDATRVFWIESDGETVHALKSVPKSGGSPTALAIPPQPPHRPRGGRRQRLHLRVHQGSPRHLPHRLSRRRRADQGHRPGLPPDWTRTALGPSGPSRADRPRALHRHGRPVRRRRRHDRHAHDHRRQLRRCLHLHVRDRRGRYAQRPLRPRWRCVEGRRFAARRGHLLRAPAHDGQRGTHLRGSLHDHRGR